jgi:DNA-binding YbaB/EbfC family protein
MFGNLGAMAGLLRQLPKLQERAAQLQKRLGEITAEGQAGGGAVTVKVNGLRQLVQVALADDTLKDKELLEDLIVAAANQAFERVQEQVNAEMAKLTTDLGLPPGLNLPGLG